MQHLSVAMLVSAVLCWAAPSYAARVQNCDKVAHDVWINNGGEEWKVRLEPWRYQDTSGPSVTFRLEGQQPVTSRWMDDWCIWSGKLHIQQRRRYLNNSRF